MPNAAKMFKEAGAAAAASNPAVKKVTALCMEQDALQTSIDELEELLAGAKARFNIIKVKELPDAMAELGSSEWKSSNGRYKVEIGDFVSGTLPKEEKERLAATDYLAKNGAGPLIKTEISLGFGKEEHAQADKARKLLTKAGFTPTIQTGVHPQSLLAWARERMKNGEPINFDLLGLFSGRQAKLTVVDIEAKEAKKAASKAKRQQQQD